PVGSGRTGPCRSASTAAPPILPSVSAPFSPPSVKYPPISRRPRARSLPVSPLAAAAPWLNSLAASPASSSTPRDASPPPHRPLRPPPRAAPPPSHRHERLPTG